MKGIIKKFINQICNLQSAICNNKKGFTLIELAIVMVIIGLILGAVMKGQDLIVSARAKKFSTTTNGWSTAVWTYIDRKGVFPGDANKNGLIGDGPSDFPKTDIMGASFAFSLTNPTTFGGNQYYYFLGSDGGAPARNILAVCNTEDCTEFVSDDVTFMNAFETSIDGSVDGAAGAVRCSNATVGGLNSTEWSINGATNLADVGTTQEDCSSTSNVMFYYFDRVP